MHAPSFLILVSLRKLKEGGDCAGRTFPTETAGPIAPSAWRHIFSPANFGEVVSLYVLRQAIHVKKPVEASLGRISRVVLSALMQGRSALGVFIYMALICARAETFSPELIDLVWKWPINFHI